LLETAVLFSFAEMRKKHGIQTKNDILSPVRPESCYMGWTFFYAGDWQMQEMQ
jgi:hypothetical protein